MVFGDDQPLALITEISKEVQEENKVEAFDRIREGMTNDHL